MRSHEDRVNRKMWRGSVSAFAPHGNIDLVGAGHRRPAAETVFTDFESGMNMQSENSLRLRIMKNSFADQEARATGVFFFSRLKNNFNTALPFGFQFVENF